MDNWEIFITIVAGVGTIAILTFVIRENSFYRFFEHLFIGIAAGLGPILTLRDFLWPKILEPMLGLDIATYPDGTRSQNYNELGLLYLLPMMFGLLYYFIYSKRLNWLAKLVIGFSLGVSGGLVFKGFFAEVIPQITSSFKPLLVFGPQGFDIGKSISNTIFVGTLLVVMYYFFFTIRNEKRESPILTHSGRWLMMVCFGAFFGSTVMARLALLVERMQFLLDDWSGALLAASKLMFGWS